MEFDYQRLYLTADGRIGRQDFWMGILGFFVVGIVLGLIIWGVFGATSFFARLLNFIIQLAFAYPSYNLMAKRFQDRDRQPMFAAIIIGVGLLLGLIGLFTGNPMGTPGFLGTIFSLIWLAIIIWVMVELGVLRGTVGQNQYGPDPVGT
jgi:uncharacterized membrane protein YhaH (DUF805 family)